jgi:D-alanyl-D-alanine carboxypeptidase
MKRKIVAVAVVVVIAGLSAAYGLSQERSSQAASAKAQTSAQQPKKEATPTPQPKFDKSALSLQDPTSLWVVVNKKRPLAPSDYVPADLAVPDIQLRSNITNDERQVRRAVADALKTMADAAQAEGVTLTLQSGYRSYTFQQNLYGRYVAQQGQSVADMQSARAGHSEHQTGLAVDLGGVTRPACNVEACFADTVEGRWVAANAHLYGFTIRYPQGKAPVTGYTFEPWHLRYVGPELALELHSSGVLTLEEFFGLPAAPDYN